VFKAEEVTSHGKAYHRKCATCLACSKKLEANTIFHGSDDNIYCSGCYAHKFATSGYRGAGTSNWVDNEASNTLRHSYQAF
jgi:hypothetical protein